MSRMTFTVRVHRAPRVLTPVAGSLNLHKSSAKALFFALTLSACGGSEGPAQPVGASPSPPPTPAPPSAVSSIASAGIVDLPGRCWSRSDRGPRHAICERLERPQPRHRTATRSTSAAGEYRGDVATWNANNLTICGIGGRAKLYANGVHEGGKGIWVIRGSNTTVHGVEFHDAASPRSERRRYPPGGAEL